MWGCPSTTKRFTFMYICKCAMLMPQADRASFLYWTEIHIINLFCVRSTFLFPKRPWNWATAALRDRNTDKKTNSVQRNMFCQSLLCPRWYVNGFEMTRKDGEIAGKVKNTCTIKKLESWRHYRLLGSCCVDSSHTIVTCVDFRPWHFFKLTNDCVKHIIFKFSC